MSFCHVILLSSKCCCLWFIFHRQTGILSGFRSSPIRLSNYFSILLLQGYREHGHCCLCYQSFLFVVAVFLCDSVSCFPDPADTVNCPFFYCIASARLHQMYLLVLYLTILLLCFLFNKGSHNTCYFIEEKVDCAKKKKNNMCMSPVDFEAFTLVLLALCSNSSGTRNQPSVNRGQKNKRTKHNLHSGGI